MVPRERLLLVAEHATRLASERRVRVAAQLLLAAGLVFAGLRLRSIWHDSQISLDHVGWGWLAGAFVLAAGNVIASAFIWLEILRLLGTPTRRLAIAVYFQGQLGKYIPGSLWQYAGRSALARRRGIPLRTVARSFPIELSSTAYVAAAFSALLLGWWGVLGITAAVAVAQAVTRIRRAPIGLRAAARVAGLYAGAWILASFSFWMAVRGLVQVSAVHVPVYAGAFAAAWIVGLVAIYAPGGIGVREAVLVSILRSKIGTADAVVVAVTSRAILTLVDVSAAGASILTLGRPRRSRPQQVGDTP